MSPNDHEGLGIGFTELRFHGFSASWSEVFPINLDFAQYFGCKVFLARLASHGIVTEDPLLKMTPDRLDESAKEALMVARQLGKKVVIMVWMVAFEKAGNHVIACDLTSGAVPDVRSQTFAFAKEVLGMKSNR